MTNTERIETLAKIQAHLATEGNKIQVCTYTRATLYDHRHANLFKITSTGLFVARGKSWDCIDYCGIRYGTTVKA